MRQLPRASAVASERGAPVPARAGSMVAVTHRDGNAARPSVAGGALWRKSRAGLRWVEVRVVGGGLTSANDAKNRAVVHGRVTRGRNPPAISDRAFAGAHCFRLYLVESGDRIESRR